MGAYTRASSCAGCERAIYSLERQILSGFVKVLSLSSPPSPSLALAPSVPHSLSLCVFVCASKCIMCVLVHHAVMPSQGLTAVMAPQGASDCPHKQLPSQVVETAMAL